jgi:hypothetical protein
VPRAAAELVAAADAASAALECESKAWMTATWARATSRANAEVAVPDRAQLVCADALRRPVTDARSI